MPALVAMASAQSTTVVSIFGYIIKELAGTTTSTTFTSFGGSVAGVNHLYTTYIVDCMSNVPTSQCGLEAPYTLIAGPTTLSYSTRGLADLVSATVTITQDVKCSFTHKTESAVCIQTTAASFEGLSTTATATVSVPTGDVTYWPLTVTAGLSKLKSLEASVTPNASASSQRPQVTQSSDAAAVLHQPLATAAPLGVAAALAVATFF